MIGRNSSLLSIKECLYLFCLYAVLLLCWGYQFGDGDLIQIDPLIKAMKDQSLYQKDFYIQQANEHFPNERSFFLMLLLPFSSHLETVSFIFHVLFSFILLSGLFCICKIFLENQLLRFCLLPFLFIPLYNINLGTNELYYGILHPSLTAKALGAWALFFWIKRKIFPAYCIIILSTLQHPVAGLQLFLLCSASDLFILIFSKQTKQFRNSFLTSVLVYLFIAGTYIFTIQTRFGNSNVDSQAFFEIFFLFRNPHHYLPSAFPLHSWIILGPLLLSAPFIWKKLNGQIFLFICFALAGCILYSIAVELFHSTTIGPIQWFKTTIWLEFLSLISLFILIEKLFPFLKKFEKTIGFKIAAVCFVCIIILFVNPGYSSFQNEKEYYNFPFNKGTFPEQDISLQAKRLTDKNALFIQPCSFSALKYYGERASVVDYKALTHRKGFIIEWAQRFQDVYQINFDTDPSGLNTTAFADSQFKNLSESDILALQKKYDINYVLTFSDVYYIFPLIAENEKYKIYQLP